MKYDAFGIRSWWAQFTYMPEYVEHKHQDCSDEKAMQIFNQEMVAQPIIKQLHGNDEIKYILSNIGNEQTSNIRYSDIT